MKTNARCAIRWITLAVAVFLVLAVLLAVAPAQDAGMGKIHKSDYAALAKVPAKARPLVNPLEGRSDDLAAGGKLFEQHCAECHGHHANGGRRGPSLRVAEVQKATAGALFFVLSNGVVRRGMPDWSKLPEMERWQIVTFLESLRER
jgi:mono/diheme cytochrome c family protein